MGKRLTLLHHEAAVRERGLGWAELAELLSYSFLLAEESWRDQSLESARNVRPAHP